jgi:hypothetical protein
MKSYLAGACGATSNDVLAGGAIVGVLGLSCVMLDVTFECPELGSSYRGY